MVDHTPSSGVSAGDVIVVGDGIRIAHSDIAANRLGALAIAGGVYDLPKATGGGTAMSEGKMAYWDNGNTQATETSVDTIFAGTIVADAADGDATVRVRHEQPDTVNTTS